MLKYKAMKMIDGCFFTCVRIMYVEQHACEMFVPLFFSWHNQCSRGSLPLHQTDLSLVAVYQDSFAAFLKVCQEDKWMLCSHRSLQRWAVLIRGKAAVLILRQAGSSYLRAFGALSNPKTVHIDALYLPPLWGQTGINCFTYALCVSRSAMWKMC